MNNVKKIVKYPFIKVKHTHNLILQIKEPLNPYKVFGMWLLDVFQYGFVAEIIRLSLLGSKGFWYSIIMIISFGLMRWFLLDFVYELRKAIKNRSD